MYTLAFHKLFASFLIWKWRVRHWIFSWKVDEEGDLAFTLMNVIAFVKYKESTILRFGKSVKSFRQAPKYVIKDQ